MKGNCRALLLAIVICEPALGRGQTPDIQGRAPLTLTEAMSALKAINPDSRVYAAESLLQLGPMAWDSIPTLLDVLKNDPVVDVRAAAARALGRVGSSSKVVVPALRAAMKDRHTYVRIRAAEALGRLSQADEAEAVAFLLRCLSETTSDATDMTPVRTLESLRQLGPRATGCARFLVRWLADSRSSVRLAVLAVLEQLDDDYRVVVPGLIAVLADEQPIASLIAFGDAGRAFLTPAVTGRLGNDVLVVYDSLYELTQIAREKRESRRMAIEMLGRYGPKAVEAVPLLTKCLQDKRLRNDAKKALERIEGRR